MIALLLVVIYYIAVFVPSIAVAVRRLHDTNKSGWFLLLSVVPFGSIVLLVFMFLDSTQGENNYGPSQKYPDGKKPAYVPPGGTGTLLG